MGFPLAWIVRKGKVLIRPYEPISEQGRTQAWERVKDKPTEIDKISQAADRRLTTRGMSVNGTEFAYALLASAAIALILGHGSHPEIRNPVAVCLIVSLIALAPPLNQLFPKVVGDEFVDLAAGTDQTRFKELVARSHAQRARLRRLRWALVWLIIGLVIGLVQIIRSGPL